MAATATPFNEETQVNTTDPPPSSSSGANTMQTGGRVAPLPDGGYLVVWEDWSGAFNPGGIAVLGQRYDAEGERVGGEFRISQFDSGRRFAMNPEVTALAGGGVAVAFTDSSFLDDRDIYVRRYDANLNLVGTDAIDTGNLETAGISIAPFADGSYVVSYTVVGPDPLSAADDQVLARIVSAAGVVGAPFAIDDDASGSAAAELATLSDGNFVAVYADEVGGSFDNVRYRIFAPDGTPVGASVLVAATGEAAPDVAALRYGGFVVAWDRHQGGTILPNQVLASVYDDAGTLVSGNIPVSAVAFENAAPTALGLADGGFVVTWAHADNNQAQSFVMVARQFDATGNDIGSEFTVHASGTGQTGAALLANSRFAYAISDSEGPPPDFDVFTRIWNPGREFAPVDGVLWQHTDGRVASAQHDYDTAPATWEIDGTGDFDGDGDTDILWHHEEGLVVTWELQDGQLVQTHSLPSASTAWDIAGTGDFDGDGDDDIVWRHEEGQVVTWEMENGVYVQNHNIESAATTWEIAGTGDFDGDGDADILWRHAEGQVVTWEMEDGEFVQSHSIESASALWSIEGTGDFDGDGDDDIVWHHRDGAVVTWEMQNGDLADVHSIADAAGDWEIQGVHDFNGDGNADLLWRHAEGLVVTWNLDGGELLQVNNHGVAPISWQIRGTGEFDLA